MTGLTRTDRFWCAIARNVDRRLLAGIPSQAVLRALFEASARSGSVLPRAATLIRDATGGLWVRPRGARPTAPAIFYIHGGGFTLGSPRTHAALAGHLAAAMGAQAYLPAYRLAPEHPFPAAPDDILAAYRAFCDARPPPVAICGDSAGGCLALQLAQAIRDRRMPAPRALALIGPLGDLSSDIDRVFAAAPGEMLLPPEWVRRARACYLPAADPADPAVSPLMGDLSGLPPALIQVGAEEVLADDARRIARAMDDATLDPWPGLPHVWHLHAGRTPAADRAIAAMGAWLRERAA